VVLLVHMFRAPRSRSLSAALEQRKLVSPFTLHNQYLMVAGRAILVPCLRNCFVHGVADICLLSIQIVGVQTSFVSTDQPTNCSELILIGHNSDLWLPPHTPGTKCVSDAANEIMMTINAGFGIFIDCVLLGLPIWIISKKMIMSRKMIQVVAIFCVGIFVVVTGVVRLFYMKTLSFASDPYVSLLRNSTLRLTRCYRTFHMSTIGVWSDLEAHIGLWCACFPALQPILRIVSFKLGLRTKLLSYGDTPGKKSAGASGHLGGASGVQRSNHGYLRSGNGIDVKGTETDSDSQKGIISKDKSFEMESMGQIHKQTDVQVSVEERQDGHKKVGRQESWIDL